MLIKIIDILFKRFYIGIFYFVLIEQDLGLVLPT